MTRRRTEFQAIVGLVLLLLLFGWDRSVVHGQLSRPGEWRIDEIVTRALADNPVVQAAEAEVEAARGRLRQAGLRPNPMLELSGQQNVAGSDNNLMAGFTVPLDLNGRKEGRTAVAEREVEVRRAQLAERKQRLRADVQMKAGEWLAARRNLAVADELLETNRRALALVGERARRGAAPPLEENLMLVEVNRLEAGRQLQASRLEILGLQLKALAGLPPEAPLAVLGDLTPGPLGLSAADGVSRGLAGRPDILVARADGALARARIAKEEAEARWDASVNIGYQRQDFGYDLSGLTDRGGTRAIRDVFHYVGAGISITLPFRNRNQGNIAAAVAETRAAERRIEFVELAARQEIAAAFTAHQAAERALQLYARGVRDVARQNLEVVRRTHELGRIPLLELIAEQRRYIEVESGYTDALRQLYEATVEVERAVGVGGG